MLDPSDPMTMIALEAVASLDEDAYERLETAKDTVRERGYTGSFTAAVIAELEQQDGRWEEYERRKRELPQDLTTAEYTEAIRELCRELNI